MSLPDSDEYNLFSAAVLKYPPFPAIESGSTVWFALVRREVETLTETLTPTSHAVQHLQKLPLQRTKQTKMTAMRARMRKEIEMLETDPPHGTLSAAAAVCPSTTAAVANTRMCRCV